VGAPAFAAVLFLVATPIFYTQSMLAQLDMPAMTLTALALLLFLDQRFIACAVACVALVLTKETSISTPLVFAAWLWLREKRRREALYFLAPVVALAAWLIVLRHATGYWLGNPGFAQYNLADSLSPVHVILALFRRIYFLLIADGRFIGTLAIFAGWSVLRGGNWTLAALVAGAQLLVVTMFGGAMLDRYVLPALPLVYAAMAAGASVYPQAWRRTSHAVTMAALAAGLFWNPPYPFPYENNLAMTDFVELQQQAASFLEAWALGKRIASVWPFTDALRRPEFGYVHHALQVESANGFELDELADLDRNKVDVLVVYSRIQPLEGHLLDIEPVREFLRRFFDYRPQATPEQLQAGLGYVRVVRWRRREQWIDIYIPSNSLAVAQPN
jgi:4-amino-4-deoxy-L-arabinose transferase-like glycosyltransferase